MGKLPNSDTALIPQRKIDSYLLSETHDAGRDKANFFRRFGFTVETWEVLAYALRQHARQHEIVKVESSPFGTRYVIEGVLSTPNGRAPHVRAVWFMDTAETIPRFVTAYPLKGD